MDFNGMTMETVETVSLLQLAHHTPLKRGVNESVWRIRTRPGTNRLSVREGTHQTPLHQHQTSFHQHQTSLEQHPTLLPQQQTPLQQGTSYTSEHLINTPLQRGETADGGQVNRFSGFCTMPETAEAVRCPCRLALTPLKRGVNERVCGTGIRSLTLKRGVNESVRARSTQLWWRRAAVPRSRRTETSKLGALFALIGFAIWPGAGYLTAYGLDAPAPVAVGQTPKPNLPPPAACSNETIAVTLVTGSSFADRPLLQNETVAILFGPGFAVPAGYRPLAGLPATLAWSQVKPLLARGDIVLVDARDRAAFQAGHIPGAVSLPLNSAPQALGEFAARFPVTTPLVIYCASSECPVSSDLARVLKDFDFLDVREMPGGFIEWLSAETPSQLPATLNSGHEERD